MDRKLKEEIINALKELKQVLADARKERRKQ
jgi:preprotein translocase subunit Sss1